MWVFIIVHAVWQLGVVILLLYVGVYIFDIGPCDPDDYFGKVCLACPSLEEMHSCQGTILVPIITFILSNIFCSQEDFCTVGADIFISFWGVILQLYPSSKPK